MSKSKAYRTFASRSRAAPSSSESHAWARRDRREVVISGACAWRSRWRLRERPRARPEDFQGPSPSQLRPRARPELPEALAFPSLPAARPPRARPAELSGCRRAARRPELVSPRAAARSRRSRSLRPPRIAIANLVHGQNTCTMCSSDLVHAGSSDHVRQCMGMTVREHSASMHGARLANLAHALQLHLLSSAPAREQAQMNALHAMR